MYITIFQILNKKKKIINMKQLKQMTNIKKKIQIIKVILQKKYGNYHQAQYY